MAGQVEREMIWMILCGLGVDRMSGRGGCRWSRGSSEGMSLDDLDLPTIATKVTTEDFTRAEVIDRIRGTIGGGGGGGGG